MVIYTFFKIGFILVHETPPVSTVRSFLLSHYTRFGLGFLYFVELTLVNVALQEPCNGFADKTEVCSVHEHLIFGIHKTDLNKARWPLNIPAPDLSNFP